MNLQEYAKHRKRRGLRGATHVAVLKAIQDGRLSPPAVQKLGRFWVIDPKLADQQWSAHTDPAVGGASLKEETTPPDTRPVPMLMDEVVQSEPQGRMPGVPSLATSRAFKAAVDVKLAKLELLEREGLYVPKETVTRDAVRAGLEVRDMVMAMADRLAPVLAVEGDVSRCHELVMREARSVLERLSRTLGSANGRPRS